MLSLSNPLSTMHRTVRPLAVGILLNLAWIHPALAYSDIGGPSSWIQISAAGAAAQADLTPKDAYLSFHGMVYLAGCKNVGYGYCNDWEASAENYVGPGNRTYRTYRNVHNNECLSHVAGLLWTQPCAWADESQWWSAQSFSIKQPCPPSYPTDCFPLYNTHYLLSPWNQPNNVATSQDGLLQLKPQVGTMGAPSQRLGMWHVVSPPW